MDIEFGDLRPYSSPGDSPFERHCVSTPDIGFHCEIHSYTDLFLSWRTRAMNKPAPLTVLLFALCNLTVVRADVKPAALFGDHLVLQQGMSVPVGGGPMQGKQVTAAAKIEATRLW